MKLAVIGSRSFVDRDKLFKELDCVHRERQVTLLISGGAVGADKLAQEWAEHNSIETKIFLPDWKKYGRSAGLIRNRDIIGSCESCIAFWDGSSKGTQSSISLAKEKRIPLKIISG